MNEADYTHDLENDAVSLLEQKKQEIIATSGGVYAVKEAISTHTKHVEKVRGELQEMVASGKLVPEIANFVMSYVGRSSKVLTDCLEAFKSRYDIKTGEALAYDNVVRKVKAKKNPPPPPAADPEPAPVAEPAPPPPSFDAVLPPAEEPKKAVKGRGKGKKVEDVVVTAAPPSPIKTRPDQRGKIGETVDRLKKARKARENGAE